MALTAISFYGDRSVIEDVTPQAVVERATRPTTDHWYAEVIAARENRINLTTIVIFEDGRPCRFPGVDAAHVNPGVASNQYVLRKTGHPKYPMMQRYALTEAERGIQLGGGSKIGDGGPVDVVLVCGEIDGVPVVSDAIKVGLYSSDVVFGPIFILRRKGGTTPPPPPPPPTPGDTRIARALVQLDAAVAILRSPLA